MPMQRDFDLAMPPIVTGVGVGPGPAAAAGRPTALAAPGDAVPFRLPFPPPGFASRAATTDPPMTRIVLLLSAATLLLAEGGPNPAAPAPAGPAPGAPAGAGGGFGGFGMIFFLVLMVLMMWFMVIRPQRKEEKRRKELIDATKRGDDVVTIGGVHGTVEAVGEATVDLRIGKGNGAIVATFNKGAIATNLSSERSAAAGGKK